MRRTGAHSADRSHPLGSKVQQRCLVLWRETHSKDGLRPIAKVCIAAVHALPHGLIRHLTCTRDRWQEEDRAIAAVDSGVGHGDLDVALPPRGQCEQFLPVACVRFQPSDGHAPVELLKVKAAQLHQATPAPDVDVEVVVGVVAAVMLGWPPYHAAGAVAVRRCVSSQPDEVVRHARHRAAVRRGPRCVVAVLHLGSPYSLVSSNVLEKHRDNS
jgi:hypothetical protein